MVGNLPFFGFQIWRRKNTYFLARYAALVEEFPGGLRLLWGSRSSEYMKPGDEDGKVGTRRFPGIGPFMNQES
jgi:hypothetical protein